MKYQYRKAVLDDLDKIMEIIEDGRAFLKPQNGGQWQDGYPNRDNIIEDINSGHFYVILTPENDIASICALTYYESDYDHLYVGSWLSELPYMVMHRCAVKDEYRGVVYGKEIFELFNIEAKKQGYHSLRIDTHENNKVMRHLIESSGFIYCGKAILTPNKDRMVFEKII